MEKHSNIAASRLAAWLKSIDIEFTFKNDGFYIKSAPGDIVYLSIKENSRAKLKLPPSVINNRDLTVAMNGLRKIVETLGYDFQPPFDRGEMPDKVSFKEDFDLLCMRHCDFRRSPNPASGVLEKYKKSGDIAASIFKYNNHALCKRNYLEVSDLKTYANVWIVNYLGNFNNPLDDEQDVYKKLYSYLMQKFYEFQRYLVKKERSCIPTFEEYSLGYFGQIVEDPLIHAPAESYEDRSFKAMELLREKLYRLPYKKMQSKLMKIRSNPRTNKEIKGVIDTLLTERSKEKVGNGN